MRFGFPHKKEKKSFLCIENTIEKIEDKNISNSLFLYLILKKENKHLANRLRLVISDLIGPEQNYAVKGRSI